MLTEILAGSVGAALVSGVALVLNVILNKKLRTPGDQQTVESNAIAERNQIMKTYKDDLVETKAKLGETMARLDALEKEVDTMREQRSAFIDWAYKAIAAIRRLGKEEDIPLPVPPGIKT